VKSLFTLDSHGLDAIMTRHVSILKWQVMSEVLRTYAEIASVCCSLLIDVPLLSHTVSMALSAQPSGKSGNFQKKYMVYN
jgi:hypothetical protein